MRDLSALVTTATEAEEGKMFWFLELQFDVTQRYTDADVDLYINTTDYESIVSDQSFTTIGTRANGFVLLEQRGRDIIDDNLAHVDYVKIQEGLTTENSIDGDILNENCNDISDWVDNDVINGVSQVNPAGQFEFDSNTAAASNKACRDRDIGNMPNTITFEIRIYHDKLENGNGDNAFVIEASQGANTFIAAFTENGFWLYNSGWIEIGTDLVKQGGSAEWQTWRFCINFTTNKVDVYLRDSTNNINYKFETMPFEIGKIGYSAKSSVDKLKIDIQNVDLTMSATLLNENIMNKWGLVYIGFYDGNNKLISEPIKVFEGLVSTWNLTEMRASITLVNEFIFWNKKVMRKHQGTCRWAFKGTECTYSGVETRCDQSFNRCETLNNRDNFGGFRFLPDLEERKIYWGKST